MQKPTMSTKNSSGMAQEFGKSTKSFKKTFIFKPNQLKLYNSFVGLKFFEMFLVAQLFDLIFVQFVIKIM